MCFSPDLNQHFKAVHPKHSPWPPHRAIMVPVEAQWWRKESAEKNATVKPQTSPFNLAHSSKRIANFLPLDLHPSFQFHSSLYVWRGTGGGGWTRTRERHRDTQGGHTNVWSSQVITPQKS